MRTKNNSIFVIFMFEILKNRKVTMSLILNNWALVILYQHFSWKDQNNVFRKDPDLKLKCVPTLLKVGKVSNFQCLNTPLHDTARFVYDCP